jgi:hypothetical protein
MHGLLGGITSEVFSHWTNDEKMMHPMSPRAQGAVCSDSVR